NVMRSGAVLRIPEASEAAAISPAEASAEIRRQYAAWRGAAEGTAPTAATEKPGRLKLVTPTEGAPAAANATPPAPAPTPAQPPAKGGSAGPAAAQAAAASEAKRLLELKNQDLARMQAEAAAKQAAPAPAPALPPPPAAKPAPAPTPAPPPVAAT